MTKTIEQELKLTNAEKLVYELLLEGLNSKEIAEKLVISKSTAKKHIHNILSKNYISSVNKLLAKEILRLKKINNSNEQKIYHAVRKIMGVE